MSSELKLPRKTRNFNCRVGRMVVALLLLLCSAACAVGINVVFATLAGLSVEECTEVTSNESAVRHAPCKSSFQQLASSKHRHGEMACSESVDASRRNYQGRARIVLIATHLLGAGINIRC